MSMTQAALLVALFALAVGGVVLLRRWYAWRQKRLITCPENERPAAVRVDAVRAAGAARESAPVGVLALAREAGLRAGVPRPDREGTGRVPRADARRALVRGQGLHVLRQADQGRRLGGPEARPARAGRRGILAWPDVPPEALPELFKTHAPVCWNCLVVQKVASEHPDDVTVRPPREQLYS